ncbi:DUF397 domain-containing protein [Streptomyces diacarni]|uniref:DUF397 domain-containing protein n=1 Tax=Streptomyces diacarni TaxID=2800381 RepID=A0A367ETC3_9ACTN|nr:DUF397 domain-containing protein [Streptomyces diacarni]RCG20657.1 DUF397 domain-containing protein [Streptomyces diacarni]
MNTELAWFKSSYSNDDGGNCVEVAACPHTIHVRDSKQHSTGPQVAFTAGAWSAFVAGVRSAA